MSTPTPTPASTPATLAQAAQQLGMSVTQDEPKDTVTITGRFGVSVTHVGNSMDKATAWLAGFKRAASMSPGQARASLRTGPQGPITPAVRPAVPVQPVVVTAAPVNAPSIPMASPAIVAPAFTQDQINQLLSLLKQGAGSRTPGHPVGGAE